MSGRTIPKPISLEEAKELINELENLDLDSVSIDQIKNKLTPLFVGYFLATTLFETGQILFRGRIMKEKPTNIASLTYPPKEEVKDNRANRTGDPVFYCSNFRNVIFFELKPNIGDYVVLSEWSTTKKLLVNNIGYTRENFNRLGSNRSHPQFNAKSEPEQTENNILIKDFFSRTFSKVIDDPKQYKLSAAIAEKHIYGDMIEGLIYPTIPMKANGDNFALKPTFVNKFLKLVGVEYIRIDKFTDFKYDITVVNTAVKFEDTGKIIWNNRPWRYVIKENYGALSFFGEHGRWIAKDENCKVVHPQ